MLLCITLLMLVGYWQAEAFESHYINQDSPCPEDWETVAGICYYFSKSNARSTLETWQDANSKCEGMAMQEPWIGYTVGLAELGLAANWNSDALMLQKIAKIGEKHWLGAINNGGWNWVTSTRPLSLDNSYWGEGNPNNSGNCLGGVVEMTTNYKRTHLDDCDCNTPMRYVCQIF